MKKLFSLSFAVIAMAATMSAMSFPASTPKAGINSTTISTNDAAYPEPGNPNPPYDK
jgi:hypothetical protein